MIMKVLAEEVQDRPQRSNSPEVAPAPTMRVGC